MIELKEICKVQCGFAFDSKKFTEDSSYYPLIRIRDVKRGFTQTYYTGEFSSEYIVHKGDLLVGMDGEFNIARWNSDDALLNQRVCRIITNNNTNEEYLRFYLKRTLKLIESKTSFVTVKHLSAKELNSLKLNLPCIEDQQRISKQLSTLELMIRKNKQVLELLDELVKARFVEMFGDVQDAKKRGGQQLKDICNTVAGGTPSTKHVEYYNGTIPWISTVSLGPNYIDGTTAKAFITQEAVDSSSTKIIPSGSILFGTRVGVGKSSINQVEMCTNQDIVAIIDLDVSKYNKLYIKYVLDTYQPYFDSIKKGATILGISSDDLKNIYVPDASLYEQNRFEKFVKQIDKSRSRIQKSLEASQELFDSLMQEYFG